jgi:hypothetical protein
MAEKPGESIVDDNVIGEVLVENPMTAEPATKPDNGAKQETSIAEAGNSETVSSLNVCNVSYTPPHKIGSGGEIIES